MSVIRYLYAPFMLVGVNGLAIYLAASALPRAWLAAWLVAAVACSFAAERLIPYEREWNRPRGDAGRDLIHAVVNQLLDVAVVAALPALSSLAQVADAWPHRAPFVVQVVLAIAVLDLGVTLTHLASHRFAPLWRLHAVHHSITRLYGFNGLMKHPLHQLVELAVGAAPLLLFGLPERVATAMAACVIVQLLLQHSNADYRVGPLRDLLALNQAHRFHHLKWPVVGDVNFGLFTLVWDHLLGTFSFDATRRFHSTDLGIAVWPRFPIAYTAQLAAPFVDRARFGP